MEYPARSKRKGITRKVRNAVFERDSVCRICGTKGRYPSVGFQDGEAELDHIVPVWCGGTNDMSNLQLLCKACHHKKSVVDNKDAKKAARIRKKNAGEWHPNRKKIQNRRAESSKWKRKINGEVVRR